MRKNSRGRLVRRLIEECKAIGEVSLDQKVIKQAVKLRIRENKYTKAKGIQRRFYRLLKQFDSALSLNSGGREALKLGKTISALVVEHSEVQLRYQVCETPHGLRVIETAHPPLIVILTC